MFFYYERHAVKYYKFFLLLVLSIYLSSAHATNCYDKSDDFEKLGESYFEHYYITLDEGKKRAIDRFLNVIMGDWRGTTEEIICIGPEKNFTTKTKEADVDVTISLSNESLLKIRIKRTVSVSICFISTTPSYSLWPLDMTL